MLDRLLDRNLAGARLTVQLHGEPLPAAADALTRARARVLTVPVYR